MYTDYVGKYNCHTLVAMTPLVDEDLQRLNVVFLGLIFYSQICDVNSCNNV